MKSLRSFNSYYDTCLTRGSEPEEAPCLDCGGTGADYDDPYTKVPCRTCKGSGIIGMEEDN